jgi:uncharacterized membrane protein
MTDIAAMLDAYPTGLGGIDHDALVLCVQECLNCGQTCTACADACLAEPDRSELARCVGTALVCADIVDVTSRTVMRTSARDDAVLRSLLPTCVEACRACYEECRRHALDHEHCRVCADACHRCAHACRNLLASLR